MKKTYLYAAIAFSGISYTLISCGQKDSGKQAEVNNKVDLSTLPEADQKLIKQANNYFGVLPDSAANPKNLANAEKTELGKALYFDARLSKSGVISCNSCHNLASYGVDNLPTSPGHKWQFGARNSPTSLNAAIHNMQFWDGRAADVEEQAKGPILNPVEMAAPHEDFAVKRIASIPAYQDWFKAAFPGEQNPVTYDNIAKAIGCFERTLLTPSRFDEYMKGDANALTNSEKKGMETFINSGCVTCHMGPAVGGNMYQKFGVKKDYWVLTGSKNRDEGRSAITKNDADKYFFKVPSLRNIEHTYPYFHDGSIWSLKKAIAIMGELQLDKKFNDEELDNLEAFLKSMTGELPQNARILPVLPASTNETTMPEFN
jgi:cytochrome c peroxidase